MIELDFSVPFWLVFLHQGLIDKEIAQSFYRKRFWSKC